MTCECWIEYKQTDPTIKSASPMISYCPLHKAAPELLNALKLNLIEQERLQQTYWLQDSPDSPGVLEARKAIAHAEGQA